MAAAVQRPSARTIAIADAAVVALLALAVAVTFGPWLRTGTAHRTSYQVVQSADRLEVLGGGPEVWLRAAWSFLPFVAVVAVLAVLTQRRRVAAALAVVVGLVEAIFGGLVTRSPRSADWGASGGLAFGSVLVVVALATAWITRSAR